MTRSSVRRAADRGAPVFAALGDATRLQVVARLSAQGPLSITRLAEGGDVTRQAVTKHLQVLESAGLVTSARTGRESVWRLERRGLDDARQTLDVISREWDATIGRLKDYVEG